MEKAKSFAQAIEDISEEFCIAENMYNNQSISATKNQLHLTQLYIQHFIKHSEMNIIDAQQLSSGMIVIQGTKDVSIFEVLLSIFMAILAGKTSIYLYCDSVRKTIFNKLANSSQFKKITLDDRQSDEIDVLEPIYGCQIIFDSADISSAFTELGKAWQDNTAPWRIRSCWIQESLKEQFFAEIQSCIVTAEKYFENYQEDIVSSVEQSRALGATVIQTPNKRSPALVCGVNRKNINCDHLVFVNFFRTAKDVITLVNADTNVVCSSIWTENISIAYEVANKLASLNVWINSNGILNPAVPMTIREKMYGSKLSLIKFGSNIKKTIYSIDGKKL